jgi:hypothetical protein
MEWEGITIFSHMVSILSIMVIGMEDMNHLDSLAELLVEYPGEGLVHQESGLADN